MPLAKSFPKMCALRRSFHVFDNVGDFGKVDVSVEQRHVVEVTCNGDVSHGELVASKDVVVLCQHCLEDIDPLVGPVERSSGHLAILILLKADSVEAGVGPHYPGERGCVFCRSW